MNNLRDQIEALAQGIATSERQRQMAVGDSKVQTARLLQAFGRERAVMAKALKSGFAADRVSRSVSAGAIRANAGKMCQEFRQDHARMRRSLRGTLAQSTEAVARGVASLRADFTKARASFTKAHHHMTDAQRAWLTTDRRDRSRNVAELMNDFHASRGEIAQKLAERLANATQEIRSQVSGLSGFRASLRKSREGASVPGQIPSYLLGARAGGAAPAPISALGHEPERHGKKEAQEKTTFSEAVRHFVGKPEKPKKK